MFNKSFLISVVLCLTMFPAVAQDLYVHSATGKNTNDGSKASPFKNIQKAIDAATDGATIHVAEGNYFGTLDKGNINVTKPVTILGGYSADFATRDVLQVSDYGAAHARLQRHGKRTGHHEYSGKEAQHRSGH